MKKEFTPGPWEVDGFNTTAVIHNEGSLTWPQWKHICNCDYGYADPEKHLENNKANARLIAAAPDLLNAVSDMLTALNNSSCKWNMDSEIERAYSLCKHSFKRAKGL